MKISYYEINNKTRKLGNSKRRSDTCEQNYSFFITWIQQTPLVQIKKQNSDRNILKN